MTLFTSQHSVSRGECKKVLSASLFNST